MSNNIVGLTSYNGILREGREKETWPPETISLCLCAPCYYILITVGLYPCHYTAVTNHTGHTFYKRFPIKGTNRMVYALYNETNGLNIILVHLI